jgi:hypothetical protein
MINLNHECACLNRETNSQTGSELFPENMILSLSVSFLHEGQPELNKILSLVDSVTEFKSGRKRSKHKLASGGTSKLICCLRMRRIGIIGSGNFACAMARVIGANAAKNSTIHPLVWSISLSLHCLL